MTDQNSEDQGIELHDDENEIMEAQVHDPANADAQSVASVDKADDSVKQAPLPSQGTAKNNTTKDPMPKTKAGMINAMTMAMQGRSKTQLASAYNGMMKQTNKEDLKILVLNCVYLLLLLRLKNKTDTVMI